MKVRLEDIPPEGLDVSFSDGQVSPADLGDQVLEITSPPSAELSLARSGDMVRAQGSFTARLAMACSRCLEPVAVELAGPLHTVFLPRAEEGAEEVRLSQDDLEMSFYQDEEIDLGASLRDEVSLALPMAPVCAKVCGGICPVCGKPLTGDACSCQEKQSDPRWAKLAEWGDKK